MKKDEKKILEVNVKITEPEDVSYDEAYYTALKNVIDAFSTLADTALETEDAVRIIAFIEGFQFVSEERCVLEMLRAMFCITGMQCAICGIDYVAFIKSSKSVVSEFADMCQNELKVFYY